MKEIFENLPKVKDNLKLNYLLDTCFLVWIFKNDHENDFKVALKKYKFAMTSFNVKEFIYVAHKLHDKVKIKARKFFKNIENIYVYDIPVSPGEWEKEHEFVLSVLPMLDFKEHDPSDAVILAAAIKLKTNVLTKDKHDIFNANIINFLNKYDVNIYNKII